MSVVAAAVLVVAALHFALDVLAPADCCALFVEFAGEAAARYKLRVFAHAALQCFELGVVSTGCQLFLELCVLRRQLRRLCMPSVIPSGCVRIPHLIYIANK